MNTDDMAGFAAIVTSVDATVTFTGDAGPETVSVAGGSVLRVRRDDMFIGKPMSADVPFGLFVGSPCSYVPYNVRACDPLLLPVPPPSSWGHEYVGAPYPPRYEGVEDPPHYRIVALHDDTRLSFDPETPNGAPAVMQAGELALFPSTRAFVVRSQDAQHPFHVSMLMTGGGAVEPAADNDAGVGGRGDPELVAVPPTSELASRFAFATWHEFPDTFLVLVRRRQPDGTFADVTLDCAGTVTGWGAVDLAGEFQTATVPITRGRFEPVPYGSGACDNGAHTMTTAGLATGYVWGWAHNGAYEDPNNTGASRSYGFALYGLPAAAPTAPTR